METLITSHSISFLNWKNPSLKSQSPQSLFHFRPNFLSSQPSSKLQYHFNDKLFSQKRFGATINASIAGQTNPIDDEYTWLLEPVGDGDSSHIGFKVAMPSSFEISSKEVTVGRVPEKADIVIPVATVSGMHARFQKKGGALLLTDLGSTNGTFIDEKRLTPGVQSVVTPGRYVTFGDTNLAIFRVSKIKNVKPSESEPQVELETEGVSNRLTATFLPVTLSSTTTTLLPDIGGNRKTTEDHGTRCGCRRVGHEQLKTLGKPTSTICSVDFDATNLQTVDDGCVSRRIFMCDAVGLVKIFGRRLGAPPWQPTKVAVVSAVSRRHQPPWEVAVGVCSCATVASGFYEVVCVLVWSENLPPPPFTANCRHMGGCECTSPLLKM
ncbi:unnamed protein product [Lactuca saligna]|uniref:FHA domain-containing protein n=1 Tax=Lactuca saligna TaxID=75948 RepID=A0AA35ZEM6_LACSI|nr:unnamed protein product [Lactuca saligna]